MTPNTPMTELPVELEPCPFCGGEAEYQTDTEEPEFAEEWIGCLKCGATTAVEIWNRRASQSLRAPAGEAVAWRLDTPDGRALLYNVEGNARSYAVSTRGTVVPLYASPPSEGVKVKALEWHGPDMNGEIYARSVLCVYTIRASMVGYWLTEVGGHYESLDKAKAAAQADYERRILSALDLSPAEPSANSPTVIIGYTNWRGEYAEREIVPMRPWFGSTDWHPEPQWLLKAWDVAKDAERDFALKDIGFAAPSNPVISDAARDVLAERKRQVTGEGWTPEHDDAHDKGELAKAAGVYALAAASHDYRWVLRGSPVNDYLAATFKMWPWDWSWFKPKDRRHDCVKAAALLLAEIERLDRAAALSVNPQSGSDKP